MTRENYTIRVQCVGTVTKTGERCIRAAIKGGVVCPAHGGRTPNIRKAAAMKLAEEQVRRDVEKARAEIKNMRDVAPLTSVGDIYDDLLEVAGVCRQWRLVLQDRVSYLTDLHTTETEHTGEQVRADVLLFERALERSAKVGEMLARLNLDERKQALDERLAARLALVIQAILADLDLTDTQQERAATVAPARVRELM